MTKMELRQQSRAYFPAWSIKQRAKWVIAKLRAPEPKIGTAPDVLLESRNYTFARSSR